MKKTNKNGEEITKTIFNKLNILTAQTFLASSLSDLADNLAQGIHDFKCK